MRNIRLVEQSPYPELNTAAILTLAQWRFAPGMRNGEPVDVLFTLTVRFSV